MQCNCGGHMKSEVEAGGNRFAIEVYGHYYYREATHMPVRITIVAEGEKPGFYQCVKGHWTKEELQEKKPEPFLIHVNRITL